MLSWSGLVVGVSPKGEGFPPRWRRGGKTMCLAYSSGHAAILGVATEHGGHLRLMPQLIPNC